MKVEIADVLLTPLPFLGLLEMRRKSIRCWGRNRKKYNRGPGAIPTRSSGTALDAGEILLGDLLCRLDFYCSTGNPES
jgi:hypothetical protein